MAPVDRVHGRDGPARGRVSKTSTGPTRRCSRSSSTWPTGPRECRSSSSALHGPSCTSGTRTGRGGMRQRDRDPTVAALRRARRPADLDAAGPGGAAGRDPAADPGARRRQPAVRRGVRAHAARPRSARRHGTLRTESTSRSRTSMQALIAARLDTLSRERKSCSRTLPSSARCSGPAPWRDGRSRPVDEVDQALHELAAKSSSARPSVVDGGTEGVHVLAPARP